MDLMDTLRDREYEAEEAAVRPLAPSSPPSPPAAEPRSIRIQFQTSPVGFEAAGGGEGTASNARGSRRLGAIRLQRTELHGKPSAGQGAVPEPRSEHSLACGLALRAVGYRSTPLEGSPFDTERGVVLGSHFLTQLRCGLISHGL